VLVGGKVGRVTGLLLVLGFLGLLGKGDGLGRAEEHRVLGAEPISESPVI